MTWIQENEKSWKYFEHESMADSIWAKIRADEFGQYFCTAKFESMSIEDRVPQIDLEKAKSTAEDLFRRLIGDFPPPKTRDIVSPIFLALASFGKPEIKILAKRDRSFVSCCFLGKKVESEGSSVEGALQSLYGVIWNHMHVSNDEMQEILSKMIELDPTERKPKRYTGKPSGRRRRKGSRR